MFSKRTSQRVFSNFDWVTTGLMFGICLMGLGVLYSAGFNHESNSSLQMQRQALAMGLGLMGFLFCLLISGNFFRQWAFVLYSICLVLLVVVLIHGTIAGGSQRWLNLGFFRLQPSELMKVGVILVLARLFSGENAPKNGYNLSTLFFPVLLLLIPMALIVVQPDLGTSLAVGLIGGSMLLLAGVQTRTLFGLGTVCSLALIPAWFMLKEYQKMRIMTFLFPEQDPLGTGYHAMQSKIAVGSGAWFGKGLLQGTQTQLRFLPEQTTDFIFSVLAEEWGFLGSIGIVLLYALLIFHLFNIAARCQDKFSAYVVIGVASLLFWQVFINIGMVIGIVPVVGITLPLLSYGGSSVVTVMAGLGLVVGIHSRRFLFT